MQQQDKRKLSSTSNIAKKENPAPTYEYINALGTQFVSDVLELSLNFKKSLTADESQWESLMWAIFTAAAKILDIPQTELGGTLYANDHGEMSLLIFDDVPGGAGHTKQLSGMVDELIKTAYMVVDGHCGCGEETCCYGCIANYYNQPKQADLSRGAAKAILEHLLNEPKGNHVGKSPKQSTPVPYSPAKKGHNDGVEATPRFTNVDYSSSGLERICDDAQADSESGSQLIDELKNVNEDLLSSLPEPNVVFEVKNDEFIALLAWKDLHIAVVEQDEYKHLSSVLNTKEPKLQGWNLIFTEETTASKLLSILEEA